MKHSIVFFNASVEERISAWPVGIYASFVRITEQIVMSGPNLGMPYTKAMGQGLFEVRARGAEGIGRAFFLHERWQSGRFTFLHQKNADNSTKRTADCQQAYERGLP
jgi:phage-related protein